jgi:hypothetical protein
LIGKFIFSSVTWFEEIFHSWMYHDVLINASNKYLHK